MAKFFVTTPIYYVNARPHIGHIYTTIAADVVARHYRAKQYAVLFSTGTDENSQKNVEAAEKAGQDVRQYVDDMAAQWMDTFKQLGFTHDTFIRTTSPEHEQVVKKFLTAIEQKGDIELGEYEGFYCVGCEEFKNESDLVNGLCPVHKTKPKKIKEKNYFFKLSRYRGRLLKHYEQNPDFVHPESARNKMLDYIKNDLADISISRQAQAWGIRLPQDPKHAVYVWFDALINYLTVAGYGSDEKKFQTFWPADLHLVGKDIIKFHCAIWPAMLMAAELEPPQRVFANGFFTVDGQKISKSLGNAIDPLELTKEYPFDAIRYFLLRDIPFGNDGDFSHERLKDRYNADLANGLGNLVSRTLNMIEKFWPDFDKALVDPTPAAQGLTGVDAKIEKLAFDAALEEIWKLIAWADLLIENKKPWELAKQNNQKEIQSVLSQVYMALIGINGALAPFMPETHEKLAKLLAARPLKKPSEPLFARK